jgi:hypothetical protein
MRSGTVSRGSWQSSGPSRAGLSASGSVATPERICARHEAADASITTTAVATFARTCSGVVAQWLNTNRNVWQ